MTISSRDKVAKAKEAAGQQAAQWVQEGMLVGIGTGSTAAFFIDHLAKRVQGGLKIQAVATSIESEEHARRVGIEILSIDEISRIDLTVDGADEIDLKKRMIKGGGGALLREKIVASNSDEMVVIVDDEKCHDELGGVKLPVEVAPFGAQLTLKKITRLGLQANLRENEEGSLYLTDNHHYIIDIEPSDSFAKAEELEERLKAIPGVLETGFFIQMAGRVIVGHADGTVEIRT